MNTSPKIPLFIYRAVHEIEQRLHEEGIYRINGSRAECEELKRLFLSDTLEPQRLRNTTDTNTICSAVKDFFRNMIDEPVLTYRLLPKFIQAFRNQDKNLAKDTFVEVSIV